MTSKEFMKSALSVFTTDPSQRNRPEGLQESRRRAVTFWMDVEEKRIFDELQEMSNKKFKSILKKELVETIRRVKQEIQQSKAS